MLKSNKKSFFPPEKTICGKIMKDTIIIGGWNKWDIMSLGHKGVRYRDKWEGGRYEVGVSLGYR